MLPDLAMTMPHPASARSSASFPGSLSSFHPNKRDLGNEIEQRSLVYVIQWRHEISRRIRCVESVVGSLKAKQGSFGFPSAGVIKEKTNDLIAS